ncbi:MAG: hypothetical protein KDM91_22200 [Verrucomicrobiae bacterium]|nr:hypothetical protein [Verrucomicrobiae bacterium]
MSTRNPFLIAGLILFGLAAGARGEETVRVWTGQDGRVIVASLRRADSESVTLRLVDGRETVVPLGKLSETDRDYLKELDSKPRPASMPDRSSIGPKIAVGGGPRTFTTAHFVFQSESDLTKGFVSDAARVFESTLKAVEALPLGIVPKPPEGETRFQARFMGRDTFEKKYRERQNDGGGVAGNPALRDIAGIYIPRLGEVWVPFSSMGVTATASFVNLRGNNDMGTLIHEITHQTMHDRLPMMPHWVQEGLAEYMEVVPYRNGSFEFGQAAEGLRQHLRRSQSLREDQPVPMPRPSAIIEEGDATWRGGRDDYLKSLMLVYFYMHLDRPDQPGAPLADYLKLLDDSRRETVRSIADHNAAVRTYETQRLAYNRAVMAHNQAVRQFRADAARYNQLVERHNAQARDRVPVSRRVAVGEKPAPPVPPEKPGIPDILKEKSSLGETVDILGTSQTMAKPSLYRGRDGAALDAAVRAAYAGMGIPVTFREAGAKPDR